MLFLRLRDIKMTPHFFVLIIYYYLCACNVLFSVTEKAS